MTFFFSSRRRHTRSLRDWSSDVCSSDLRTVVRASLLVAANLQGRSNDRPPRDPVLVSSGFAVNDTAGKTLAGAGAREIGRASCRERAWMRVGAGAVE